MSSISRGSPPSTQRDRGWSFALSGLAVAIGRLRLSSLSLYCTVIRFIYLSVCLSLVHSCRQEQDTMRLNHSNDEYMIPTSPVQPASNTSLTDPYINHSNNRHDLPAYLTLSIYSHQSHTCISNRSTTFSLPRPQRSLTAKEHQNTLSSDIRSRPGTGSSHIPTVAQPAQPAFISLTPIRAGPPISDFFSFVPMCV